MLNNRNSEQGGGVHLLQNRFCSGLPKNAKVFRAGKSYRKTLELGLVISLVVMITLLQLSKRMNERRTVIGVTKFSLDVVDSMPQTMQRQSAMAPSRPSVPIASEDEEIPEDETIEFTNLDYEEVPPPPPPLPPAQDEWVSIPMFVAYDEPPEPIGGFAAIQKHLVYPEIGRLAGVQGKVILWVQVGKDGETKQIKVAKSMGLDDFNQAAIKAVLSVRWKPAKQRDIPVTVWISVPIQFVLKDRVKVS